MLDLLLVNAPSRERVYGPLTEFAAIEPPVWAGLIATAARRAGFSVAILDAEAEGLTVAQTARRIVGLHPRLAAFAIYGQQPSASTQCLPAASAVAKLVQEGHMLGSTYDIPTLAFGTHPSALPERMVREESFDYAATGEASLTILGLLQRVPPSIIPSLRFKGRGEVVARSLVDATLIQNLDAVLPGQAWDLLDMTRYRAHNWHLWTAQCEIEVIPTRDFTAEPTGRERYTGGYASVQTSLGCPFRCTFCCINAPFGGSSIRYWSVENVIRQIGDLVDIHHITNIKIPDEMFTLNPARVKELCRALIAPGYGKQLNIWAYARIDTVRDEEMLTLMREAGFRWLGLGIESGSAHVRDGVAKGKFGTEDIFEAVARVRSAGICVGANYIFGLPDDTYESMQETLDLACALNTEWANFYCAMAYPGSALHAQVAHEHPEWLPENNPCGWVGYSQHAAETLPLPTATLSAAEVLAFRDEAFMRYFSRPKYLTMLRARFDARAVSDVHRMLAAGKPARDLLKKKEEVLK